MSATEDAICGSSHPDNTGCGAVRIAVAYRHGEARLEEAGTTLVWKGKKTGGEATSTLVCPKCDLTPLWPRFAGGG